MPLFYQHNINESTRLAIWKIEEKEAFFSVQVSLQREISHPFKRLQHLAGRYLLLQLFPDFPTASIALSDSSKPYLPDGAFYFSISHSGSYAAAIVSRTSCVGIDIERPRQKVMKIIHKFLHKEEQCFFKLDPASIAMQHNYPEDFNLPTVLWSAKEAMFKWWGRGQVEFSEMLRIEPFLLGEEGRFKGSFNKTDLTIPVQLNYRIFQELCMVWLITDAAH